MEITKTTHVVVQRGGLGITATSLKVRVINFLKNMTLKNKRNQTGWTFLLLNIGFGEIQIGSDGEFVKICLKFL